MSESISMTIRKITDNIELLVNGGKLYCPDANETYTFDVIVLANEDGYDADFSFLDFADLIEYVEPQERIEELEGRIAELESQLKAQDLVIEPKHVKPRVVYDKSSKLKISQEWKIDRTTEKPMKLKDMAQKHNISSNYLVSILKEFGVYEPKKKNQKVNASID